MMYTLPVAVAPSFFIQPFTGTAMCKYNVLAICMLIFFAIPAKSQHPPINVLVLYENGGHHLRFSQTAKIWLDSLAQTDNLRITYLTRTDSIDENFLSKYQLFFQLDYPPYAWKEKAAAAFTLYIDSGKGGWIGLHHATLLGEFDGYPMWSWFSDFMGGIRYKNYIANFVSANVRVEDHKHPVMQGLPASLPIQTEEFYTYNMSPRPRVHVLANVDESSYRPESSIKMGDHPVVWTNEKKRARNVYIFMGHSPDLFQNSAYKRLLLNAVNWASGRSN